MDRVEHTAQPFNVEAALKELDGDQALLDEVTDLFLRDSPIIMEEVRRAVGAAQAKAIRTWAHSLKGMVVYFAVPPLYQAALEVENAGAQGSVADAQRLLPALERELLRTTAALKLYREERVKA